MMATSESLIAGDLGEALGRGRALLSEIRKGKALLRLGQRILMDRRFQLGELLSSVRKHFPVSGKGAAGWGRFCRALGIKRQTAARYIEIAEQVALRPELAERRTFLDIYLELGLTIPPPQDRFAPVTVANVIPAPTPAEAPVSDEDEDEGEDDEGLMDPADEAADEVDDDSAAEGEPQRGRPPLSERERRNDIYMVRLNTVETVRLRRLSGLLVMRDAEVFREGLLALEEREAEKAAPLNQRHAPAPLRKVR